MCGLTKISIFEDSISLINNDLVVWDVFVVQRDKYRYYINDMKKLEGKRNA